MSLTDVLTYAIFAAVGVGICVGVVVAIREYRARSAEERQGFKPKAQTGGIALIYAVKGALTGGFGVFVAIMAVLLVLGIGRAVVDELFEGGGSSGDAAPSGAAALPGCAPSYPDACLKRNAVDYDCAGGPGDGPRYVTGPIPVRGSDPFGLDADGNGIGCE